jgi:hypothetical protein
MPDRVEKVLVGLLQIETSWSLPDLERSLYAQFPGLLAPSKGLVAAVLASYAVQESGRWRLREEDLPASRRADLREMGSLIEKIGARLEYSTEHPDERTCIWSEGGKKVRIFYLLVSGLVAPVLNEVKRPGKQGILVIPGGRAGLLAYKQNRDPALRGQLNAWCILKFRLLRTLADIPVLNRQTFEEQIISDPVEQLQGQLMMF